MKNYMWNMTNRQHVPRKCHKPAKNRKPSLSEVTLR